MILLSFLLLLGILLSAAFSGMETGVYSAERVRLQLQAAEGNHASRAILALLADPARAVCTLLVMNNVVNWFVSWVSGRLLERGLPGGLSEIQVELVNTAFVVPVLFVFGELVPKDLFLRYPIGLLPKVQPLHRVASILLFPIVNPLLALLGRISGEKGERHALLFQREALKEILTTGGESLQLRPAQRRLANRLLAMTDVRVESLMVPLAEVVTLSDDASREDIVALWTGSRRSRLLVNRRGQPEEFLGYVGFMDVLFAEPSSFVLADLIHELPEVKAETLATAALAQLQAARRPLALVRAQTGRPVGLLSLSDIVAALLSGKGGGSGARPRLAPEGEGH